MDATDKEQKTMAEVFGVQTTPMAWGIAKQLIAGFEASNNSLEASFKLKHIHLVAMAYQLGMNNARPTPSTVYVDLDAVDRAALQSMREQIDMLLERKRMPDGQK